jgi:hypothetical protein
LPGNHDVGGKARANSPAAPLADFRRKTKGLATRSLQSSLALGMQTTACCRQSQNRLPFICPKGFLGVSLRALGFDNPRLNRFKPRHFRSRFMTRINSVLRHARCLTGRGLFSALALSAMLVMLSGCGKATETATEKAGQKVVEKMIESAAQKDGGTAKVDLSGGSAKVTTTDVNGKVVQMEMGGAKVTEADLGLPIYPGATPIEGKSTKMNSSEGNMATLELQTNDAPEKVAAFYRERLKAKAEGNQMMDMNSGDGNISLMLNDSVKKESFQINLRKRDAGTEVTMISSRGFK